MYLLSLCISVENIFIDLLSKCYDLARKASTIYHRIGRIVAHSIMMSPIYPGIVSMYNFVLGIYWNRPLFFHSVIRPFDYYTFTSDALTLFNSSVPPNGTTDQTKYSSMFYLSSKFSISFVQFGQLYTTLIFKFRTFIRLRKCARRSFSSLLLYLHLSLSLSLSLLDRTISDCCENKIKSRINFCPHRLWLITQKLGKMGIPIEIACFIDEMLIGWIPSALFSFSTPPNLLSPSLSFRRFLCISKGDSLEYKPSKTQSH